jgi:hypothetical protein
MKTLYYYMTGIETSVFSPAELKYWIGCTLATRSFGHTYVHKAMRDGDYVYGDIVFAWSSWGRSLLSGGHKYKVHARYTSTGKPVPTKILKSL